VDVAYINPPAADGTFYYLCTILDGCSRYVVHWEIRESMTETDVEITTQRAIEKFPGVHPRIISDNGPQFIARDFKEFIRITGMTHVRTSPYYPQSNGKVERWHKTLKSDCIRPMTPLSLEDAQSVVGQFVTHYNEVRLHSAIGYVTPKDRLEGRHETIFQERDRKLDEARERRRARREALHRQPLGVTRQEPAPRYTIPSPEKTEAGPAGESACGGPRHTPARLVEPGGGPPGGQPSPGNPLSNARWVCHAFQNVRPKGGILLLIR
jgi:hypothetical protein